MHVSTFNSLDELFLLMEFLDLINKDVRFFLEN